MDIRELLDAVAPLATELEDTWVVSQRTIRENHIEGTFWVTKKVTFPKATHSKEEAQMEAAHQTLIETLDYKKVQEAEGTESGAWTVIIAGFPNLCEGNQSRPAQHSDRPQIPQPLGALTTH